MKRILLTLMVIVAAVVQSYAIFDKYTINRENLPQEAREMLDEYFPKAKVGMIKVDKHLLKKTDYDVRLVNGTTIEFSNKGKWTSVDCKSRTVPDGLVPRPIRKYVSKNFSGLKIVSIRKKTAGYEIGLSDGVVLKFNLLGSYTGVVEIEEE
ncbi:MAG: PepSY-like domain-containing protein [Muribaculaceae bacterium]|nr:PepSY-like domain-containing protein [Muribaculaceae bacterium]